MRAEEARGGEAFDLVLTPKPAGPPGLEAAGGHEVIINWSRAAEAHILTWSGGASQVVGSGQANHSKLERVSGRRECFLIVSQASADRLILRCISYPRLIPLAERHRIHIPEHILRYASPIGAAPPTPADVIKDFIIEPGLPHLPLAEEDWRLIARVSPNGSDHGGSLRLIGRRGALDVRVQGTTLVATKYVSDPNITSALAVIRGSIEFGTEEGHDGIGGDLDRVVKTASSYMEMWRRYNDIEQKLSFDRFKGTGKFTFELITRSPSGMNVRVHGEGDRERLALLKRPGTRVIAASSGARKPGVVDPEDLFTIQEPEGVTFSVDHIDEMGGVVTLSYIDDEEHEADRIPTEGFLVPTVRGDRRRLERRNEAWRRIADGKSAMPDLQDLIDQGATRRGKSRSDAKLSTVLARHFTFGATDRQRQAVTAALTTPDIMLIQGPPGTGKTQVIAALADLLGEELADLPVRHRILVASEQNETVQHITQRVHQALGLEPVVVAAGRDRDAERNQWALERADAILDRWEKSSPEIVRLRQLQSNVTHASGHSLSTLGALSQVDFTLDHARDSISVSVRVSLEDMRSRLRREARRQSRAHDSRVLNSIRRLPMSRQAIADGGWLTIQRTVRDLRGEIEPEELAALEDFTRDRCQDAVSAATALAPIRSALIDRFTRSTHLGRGRDWRDDVLPLVEKARDELTLAVSKSEAGPILAALEFAESLRADPSAAALALEQYSPVTAATNQMAASDQALRLLAIAEPSELWFDTVIIDEAARANPLDLMIPMSLARHRIILVGDHRQLPQMLEPDVEVELRESTEAETQEAFRESLFERMVKLVRESDAQTGRRRTVMLDRQFRMHPQLGDFVSETFYREDGGILSPRPAGEFVHDDPAFPGLPAVWIDVPRSAGKEHSASSRSRKAEAREVATLIARWHDQCAPQTTMGAVSLYSAQAIEIRRALVPSGLVVETEKGDLQVSVEARSRLRVGTVDAFQGREFDLVALSLVRSNDMGSGTARFGFLKLANRLCVAMSRQRKLLVVVGDLAMFQGELAQEQVPALHAFASLCESHGSVIRG